MAASISKALGWALDPFLIFLLLLTLTTIFASEKRLTLYLILLIGAMGLVSLSPLPDFLIARLESQVASDHRDLEIPFKEYAVVLGGDNIHFLPEKKIFNYADSFDRLGEALHLYKQRKIGRIIVTGGDVEFGGQMVNEAKSAAQWLKAVGVPASDILIEDKSRSTRENAVEVLKIINANKISDFYLITTASHMPRALAVFQKLGMQPTPWPVDFRIYGRSDRIPWNSLGLSRLSLFKMALHEYVGLAYYQMLGYL